MMCGNLPACLPGRCAYRKDSDAPAGSVIVGSVEFIAKFIIAKARRLRKALGGSMQQARRLRKALGGSMRQVGVLAAAGLVALQESVPRLIRDHQRAMQLAGMLRCCCCAARRYAAVLCCAARRYAAVLCGAVRAGCSSQVCCGAVRCCAVQVAGVVLWGGALICDVPVCVGVKCLPVLAAALAEGLEIVDGLAVHSTANIVSTVDSNIVSTVDSNIVSTVDSNIVSTVDSNIVSTVDSNIVSTVDSNIVSTVDSNIVSTVDSNIVSTVDSNIVTMDVKADCPIGAEELCNALRQAGVLTTLRSNNK
ncbi:unnamed protein product [Closterium sp. NIES-64]|nr:unnamed protein product [Closterium sp. NIES-64]